MFGEVKLGEADYTVIWETLLFMSNIYVKYPGKGLLKPTASSRLFPVGKCEKHSPQMGFFANMIKLVLINMLNPTFAPNLVT